MISHCKNIQPATSQNHKGGTGITTFYPCFSATEPDNTGIRFVGKVSLEPGASIGEHPHGQDDEVYIVVNGNGVYSENGVDFDIEEGAVLLLRRGNSHGMRNTGTVPLVFYAVVAG